MAKKKFDSLNSVFESERTQSATIVIKRYKSNYEYGNILGEDKEKLINSEEEIKINKEEINKCYFKIAKTLYGANEILASYDKTNGSFISWFESLGLKKTFVYNSIKRYDLYLVSKNEDIINKLSQKAVEIIGSKKLDNEIKRKILNEEKIENISDKELKIHVLNIISERSEMIEKVPINKERGLKLELKNNKNVEKKIENIKKLINEVEEKLKVDISLEQIKKLEEIERILKKI